MDIGVTIKGVMLRDCERACTHSMSMATTLETKSRNCRTDFTKREYARTKDQGANKV